jgi:RimJ/RimL family protein N-acetyltransferase
VAGKKHFVVSAGDSDGWGGDRATRDLRTRWRPRDAAYTLRMDSRSDSPSPSRLPDIPVLTTARLTLRGHRLDDFGDCVRLWSDPAVIRHIAARPFTEEEIWTRLLRYAGHWALMGFGFWMVRETSTDRFVGEVGFAEHRRDLTPSVVGMPEIGWVLTPDAHGQGFATEAVRAAVDWGDARFGRTRTVCLIHPDNRPSLRVAKKTGYREYARTTYKDAPTILLER